MASKKKPGIGRITKKKRTIKSYVGTDVAKACEAVGIPIEVTVDAQAAALNAISGQLARLVEAAEKLVAKANEPVVAERKPRVPRAVKEAAEQVLAENPPEPKPFTGKVEEKPLPPPPTLDELRAAAVAYAGKHGKEQLVALLQRYNPEGKLSTIPENNLSPCLAALKMGMVD
jgi:hypothetical protein